MKRLVGVANEDLDADMVKALVLLYEGKEL